MTKIVSFLLILTCILAAGLFARGAVLRDRDYRRLIEEGDEALARGSTFEAIEAYSGAVVLKRGSMLAYLKRGEAHHRRGQTPAVLSAALRDLRTATALDPTSTRALEELGDINLDLGRSVNALENFEQYLLLDEATPAIHYKVALAARGAGTLERAVTALQRAIALSPAFHEAHYLLGVCFRERGQMDEARAALERAVALSPAFLAAREELADLYALAGRDRDEMDHLEALYALDPVQPERLLAVSRAHLREGNRELALATLRRAAERFPDHPAVSEALGELWLSAAAEVNDRSHVSKALEVLEPASARTSATSRTLTLYGRALALAGHAARAESVLRQATQRFPVEPAAFAEYATLAQKAGRLGDARQARLTYGVLVTDERESATNAARIGDLSLEMNDTASASRWYRQSMMAAPPDASLLARLADTEARAGNLDEARALLSRAIGLDPSLPLIRTVSRRLQPR